MNPHDVSKPLFAL